MTGNVGIEQVQCLDYPTTRWQRATAALRACSPAPDRRTTIAVRTQQAQQAQQAQQVQQVRVRVLDSTENGPTVAKDCRIPTPSRSIPIPITPHYPTPYPDYFNYHFLNSIQMIIIHLRRCGGGGGCPGSFVDN